MAVRALSRRGVQGFGHQGGSDAVNVRFFYIPKMGKAEDTRSNLFGDAEVAARTIREGWLKMTAQSPPRPCFDSVPQQLMKPSCL